jgi:2-oxoglutarate ferredoxin oxidoreductase subunit alpha
VRRVRLGGKKVDSAHLFHLNPLPHNVGEVLRSYRKVIVPEMNMGQLVRILRAEFLVDADSVTKVEGLPFFADELEAAILERVSGA